METIEIAGEVYERVDALKHRLGIGEMTLWRFSDGMPKSVKIGRWRFYSRREIDTWLLNRNKAST